MKNNCHLNFKQALIIYELAKKRESEITIYLSRYKGKYKDEHIKFMFPHEIEELNLIYSIKDEMNRVAIATCNVNLDLKEEKEELMEEMRTWR